MILEVPRLGGREAVRASPPSPPPLRAQVGIRDIALALPLLTFGLPSLPLAEQLQVLCAALFAAALTNAGTVVVALAYGAPTWSLVRHCKRAKPDDPAAETRSDTSDEGSGLTAHTQL